MLECDLSPHTPPAQTPQIPVAAGLARGSELETAPACRSALARDGDLTDAPASKPCCYVDCVVRTAIRTAASTSTANTSAPTPIKNNNR